MISTRKKHSLDKRKKSLECLGNTIYMNETASTLSPQPRPMRYVLFELVGMGLNMIQSNVITHGILNCNISGTLERDVKLVGHCDQ